MTRIKTNELRGLSLQEIVAKEAGCLKELFDLRQKKMTGQLDKPHRFKAARREVAQLKTIKREKLNEQSKSK